ncbi:MAG: hypothetical protein ACHP85_00770 [Burkholderiales bacterium]|jgi:hypothetical protein
MRWVKQGCIFTPPPGPEWRSSHAALPVVERVEDRYRVYFSARDPRDRASIGWFEFRVEEPGKILTVGEEPALALGPLGAFDDCGVTSACLVRHEGRRYLYYSGWSLAVSVPFSFFVGLAVSEGDGEFRRASAAPVLGRSAVDPYLTASPSVLVENGLWRMWYVSGTGWTLEQGQPQHHYHIRYAESRDGIKWQPTGIVCIDYADASENSLARPYVLKDGGRYRMWYSRRGQAYRIGYAESDDGVRWQRRDGEAGIDVSDSGWDAEMIAYPCVFRHEGRLFMLYNGNGYGRTGVGLAVLAEG